MSILEKRIDFQFEINIINIITYWLITPTLEILIANRDNEWSLSIRGVVRRLFTYFSHIYDTVSKFRKFHHTQ